MKSARASELKLEHLRRYKALQQLFPIEFAQLRASAKQKAFQRKFFARKDDDGRRLKIFAALGGNRSGKTYVTGPMCFAKYVRDRAVNGDRFWCVAVTLDRSIGGQQMELWHALPRWMFGEQTWSEKIGFGMHRKIVLPTKDGGRCVIEFRSGDQGASTFEQAKLRGVWADEKLPEEIFNRLLPRVIDLNGFILISDIPGSWWHHSRLMEIEPTAGVLFQHFEMADNAHNLPEGAIEEAAANMTEDERNLRIHGLMVIMEGIVYREYIDQLRVSDGRGGYTGGHLVKRFTIPPGWPKWRLIDYGASAPTAGLWVAIAPNEHAYFYREHYQRNLSVQKNAAAIIAASGNLAESVIDEETGLPTGRFIERQVGEQYRQTFIDPHAFDKPPVTYGAAKNIGKQYAEAGIEATGWPFVNVMGEHAMVQRVKFRWENRTAWVFEDLINLRRELRSWKYRTDKEGKPLAIDAFEDDNNHLLDDAKGFFGTNPCFALQMFKVTAA